MTNCPSLSAIPPGTMLFIKIPKSLEYRHRLSMGEIAYANQTNPLTCSCVIPPAIEKPKLILGGFCKSISWIIGGVKRRTN